MGVGIKAACDRHLIAFSQHTSRRSVGSSCSTRALLASGGKPYELLILELVAAEPVLVGRSLFKCPRSKRPRQIPDNTLDNGQQSGAIRYVLNYLYSVIYVKQLWRLISSPSSWCVCQFRHFRVVVNPSTSDLISQLGWFVYCFRAPTRLERALGR